MVILIGGTSCAGKTLLAQKLLERYKIPYLSIDHIKMGLIRGNRYCDFSATDSDDKLTGKLWPIVRGIIMTNIENGQHIIIEGCYIPPGYQRDFAPGYLEHIIAFFIGFSKEYIEKHFDSGIMKYRSVIEDKEYDPGYMRREHFIKLTMELKNLCSKHKANYFEIDENYEKEIMNVYQWIDEQVQQKRFLVRN